MAPLCPPPPPPPPPLTDAHGYKGMVSGYCGQRHIGGKSDITPIIAFQIFIAERDLSSLIRKNCSTLKLIISQLFPKIL